MKNPILWTVLVAQLFACGSNNQQNQAITRPTTQRTEINISNEEQCLNYLKGKNFYQKDARIEIQYDGNAYVYQSIDNKPVFVGYVEIGEMSSTGGREFKIYSASGGSQFLNLMLTSNGNITDMMDFSVYHPPASNTSTENKSVQTAVSDSKSESNNSEWSGWLDKYERLVERNNAIQSRVKSGDMNAMQEMAEISQEMVDVAAKCQENKDAMTPGEASRLMEIVQKIQY